MTKRIFLLLYSYFSDVSQSSLYGRGSSNYNVGNTVSVYKFRLTRLLHSFRVLPLAPFTCDFLPAHLAIWLGIQFPTGVYISNAIDFGAIQSVEVIRRQQSSRPNDRQNFRETRWRGSGRFNARA